MNDPFLNIIDQKTQFNPQHNLENIFEQLFLTETSGYLQIVCRTVTYFIYLAQGQLIHATNSVAPFERVERHIHRLSNANQNLTKEIIKQKLLKFKTEINKNNHITTDYQAICELLEQKYLNYNEALIIQRRINREVFESLIIEPNKLSIKVFTNSDKLPELGKFDLMIFIEECKCRLSKWKDFLPEICSSYQRPYLVTESVNNLIGLNSQQTQSLCKLINNLSFRQISAIIDKDELIVVKILYPSIINKIIVLRNPKIPFDRLPKIEQNINDFFVKKADCTQFKQNKAKTNSNNSNTLVLINKNWKIAYVDNQLIVQEQICNWLDNQMFSLSSIHEPLNAFAQLIDIQPDLVFLAIDMPDINGYELCNLLKKHSTFKNIPIILVARDLDKYESLRPERNLLNLTKTKVAGATDFIAQPANKSSLLSIIFKYLE